MLLSWSGSGDVSFCATCGLVGTTGGGGEDSMVAWIADSGPVAVGITVHIEWSVLRGEGSLTGVAGHGVASFELPLLADGVVVTSVLVGLVVPFFEEAAGSLWFLGDVFFLLTGVTTGDKGTETEVVRSSRTMLSSTPSSASSRRFFGGGGLSNLTAFLKTFLTCHSAIPSFLAMVPNNGPPSLISWSKWSGILSV